MNVLPSPAFPPDLVFGPYTLRCGEKLLLRGDVPVPDAVVVRRPDEQWGEVPVVITAEAPPALAELRALVVERLG